MGLSNSVYLTRPYGPLWGLACWLAASCFTSTQFALVRRHQKAVDLCRLQFRKCPTYPTCYSPSSGHPAAQLCRPCCGFCVQAQSPLRAVSSHHNVFTLGFNLITHCVGSLLTLVCIRRILAPELDHMLALMAGALFAVV